MGSIWMLFFNPKDQPAQVLGAFSSLERAVEERNYWMTEGAGSDYRWRQYGLDPNPLMLRTEQGDKLTVKGLVIDLPISSWQFHRKPTRGQLIYGDNSEATYVVNQG